METNFLSIKKIALFLLLSSFLNAQVIYKYPEKQEFYKGGYEQFYKDAHEFLIKNSIKPCENKSEVYLMKILVNADGRVNFVKDDDLIGIEKNKCAFDIGKKILANLTNYIPAEVDDKKTPALARIIFYPDELFSSDNIYQGDNFIVEPTFPGGISNYRKKFISCFNENAFNYSDNFKFTINFEVDTQGNIQNIFIDTIFDNEQFVKMILDCVVPRKLKFSPGTYKGTPLIRMFKLPVTLNLE